MEYCKNFTLKNGNIITVRNGKRSDGDDAFLLFNATHGETDYLTSYPDENSFDAAQEGEFLDSLASSPDSAMLCGFVDGVLVGMASFEPIGRKDKLKHRAELGISVSRSHWGMGIGRILMESCISCALSVGYLQLELQVVADNERAVALYKSLGFTEFGRNPRGFLSRRNSWQELVHMRLELDGPADTK